MTDSSPTALADRVALVTGGSGGIGAEIARRLAAQGVRVAIACHLGVDAAQAVCEAIVAAGGSGLVVQGDASRAADADRMVAETIARFGGLHILVNCAGISTPAAFGTMTEAQVDRELAVNVRSVVMMTQAAALQLEGGGRVINVGSNLAFAPLAGLTLYSAAKAAVGTLTQGFARELGSRGIAVNAVAPGATDTAMTAWLPEDIRAGIIAQTPLRRFGEPGDIADVVCFLASPSARWINGRTIIVDGGLV